MQNATDKLIQVFDTYITLPSGRQLSLDCRKRFTPNPEFWQLWRNAKLDVKRAGVSVKLENDEYRGYIRESSDIGFNYSQSDLHAYWVEKAKEKAKAEQCELVIVEARDLSPTITGLPCHLHKVYEVVAKRCTNNTFQLRLNCRECGKQTPGAIAWEKFGFEVVIGAIAYTLQQRSKESESFFDNLKGTDWV